MSKHNQSKAKIPSDSIPPHLAALVADGTVRPGNGSRYLPTPAKLRSAERAAATYVSEGRR